MNDFSFQLTNRATSSSRRLEAEKDFRFGFAEFAKFFYRDPSPRQLDLLRVATAIYATDRRVRRTAARSQRDLLLRIACAAPDFWNAPEIRSRLSDIVFELSADHWEFEFEQLSSSHNYSKLSFNDPLAGSSPIVCLYSGGLDSVAGLAIRMSENPSRPFVPVTVLHQPGQRKRIGRDFQSLETHFGVDTNSLTAKVAMIWGSTSAKKQESSQRCRSFLFAALGAVTAVMLGESAVEIYESGIGVINIPLMSGMTGWKATKSCHPVFLQQMSELISLAVDREIAFRLPFFNSTKGQMVKRLRLLGLEDLAKSSASCIHFPLRDERCKQCGTCPACIFRRLSMGVATIDEGDDAYQCDLLARNTLDLESRQIASLKAYLVQLSHLDELATSRILPEQFRRHLYGTGVLRHGESPEPIIRLLLRYREEWLDFVESARLRGCHWAKLAQSHMEQGVNHVTV